MVELLQELLDRVGGLVFPSIADEVERLVFTQRVVDVG
jgi:hypothetical protein